MSLVWPCCRRSRLTVVQSPRPCGSAISSAVTSHGPIGAKVSALLPLVVPPPCSIWNSRSETSLSRQ
jgi:hypothetical protein